MYTINDFKVVLLNPEQVKSFIENHGIMACVCYDTNEKYAEKVGLSCLKEGHTSGSRGDFFKFEIECPRFCYDENTEILTNEGWKFFKDIKENEIVATRNPDTGLVEFHKIDEKISYEYEGMMHKIQKTNVDLVVTENHRMYYKKHDVRINKDKFYVTPINEINVNKIHLNKEFNYVNETKDFIEIKGYTYQKKQATKEGIKLIDKYTGDLKLNKNTFFKFLAWYLSDGNTNYDKNENKYSIRIAQTKCEENIKNDTRGQIKNIINDLGFTPIEYEKGICFNSLTLGKFLKELGLCDKKHIPFDLYKEFTKEYALVFLNEYFKGDGHIDKKGCGKFYTASKKLADQLQELCFIAGWTAMIYKRGEDLVGTKHVIEGREVNINHVGYVINVSFNKRNREPLINLNMDRKIYKTKEMVYCVNVTNHIIFVRRNGKAIWCCNCADQIMRHEVGVFKNCQSQRYVDMDNFEIYVPLQAFNDGNLYANYKHYEEECKRMYQVMRLTMEQLNKSGEVANDLMRTMLPIGVKTKLRIGFTIEALTHFMEKRLCTRADVPIQRIAQMMREEVLKVEPRYDEFFRPQCKRLMYCPEKHCCGASITKEQLIEKLK